MVGPVSCIGSQSGDEIEKYVGIRIDSLAVIPWSTRLLWQPVFGPLAASEPDNTELIAFLVRILLQFV